MRQRATEAHPIAAISKHFLIVITLSFPTNHDKPYFLGKHGNEKALQGTAG